MRVEADDVRLEASGDELTRQRGPVAPPERESAAPTTSRKPLFPVGADVLEEEVAEDNLFDVGQRRRGKRLGHARLIDLVLAGSRNHDLNERNA